MLLMKVEDLVILLMDHVVDNFYLKLKIAIESKTTNRINERLKMDYIIYKFIIYNSYI